MDFDHYGDKSSLNRMTGALLRPNLSSAQGLFELGLFEFNVFTNLRVVFHQLKFTCAGATVLSGCVKVSSARGALELDFFAFWLCHDRLHSKSGRRAPRRSQYSYF